MPVRAIINSEWRHSCACRAKTISVKTPSRDSFFCRFGGFWRIRLKNLLPCGTAFIKNQEDICIKRYVCTVIMIERFDPSRRIQ